MIGSKIILLLLLMSPSSQALAEKPACPPSTIVRQKYKQGRYEITVKGDPDFVCQTLDIKELGKTVYNEQEFDMHYYLNASFSERSHPFLDLTGRTREPRSCRLHF